MKRIYFTVGPSQLYPTVTKHMKQALKEDIASVSHRGPQFAQMYKALNDNLKKLLNIPSEHHIFFTGSSIESMERIIQNTVLEQSFHIINGQFAKKFFNTAIDLQKHPEKYEVPDDKPFDFTKITIPKKTELLCITQNDTSTGSMLSMDAIYDFKKANPSVLMAVDLVSAAPYTPIDFTNIDIAFLSVQKGLGLPAGLGILIVNEQAIEKTTFLQQKGCMIGTYHSFPTLLKNETKLQTPETPNVLNIYLTGKVLEDMLSVGIDTIRSDTDKKASLIYNFFDNHPIYKPLRSHNRSQTTIVIDVKGQTEKLVKKLANKGFIIGKGYGKNKDDHIRIANFPAHRVGDVRNLLRSF